MYSPSALKLVSAASVVQLKGEIIMFTWQHIVWLVICFLLIAALLYSYQRRRPPLQKVMNSALILAIVSEIVKILCAIEMVPSANGDMMMPYLPLEYVPLHFCRIQIIVITVARITGSKKVRETLLAFAYPCCTVGAFFAMMIPTVFSTDAPVEEAFVSPAVYQYFLFHAMLVALGIIIARSGEIHWERRHIKLALLVVYGMGLTSIYINSMFASPTYVDGKLQHVDYWTNFFFTYQNPLNIKITELWQWVLYIGVLAVLVAIAVFATYLPVLHRQKTIDERNTQ